MQLCKLHFTFNFFSIIYNLVFFVLRFFQFLVLVCCTNCRSTETQVNPSSALKRTKHHQSDLSIVPGILGSSWLQRAYVHTSKSSTNYTNWNPFSNRIRSPTGLPKLLVSTLLAGLLNLCSTRQRGLPLLFKEAGFTAPPGT